MRIIKLFLFIFLLPFSCALGSGQDGALRLSEGAEITGTRVLLIGFEGLFGFNSTGSSQAVDYQCSLSHGLKGKKPGGVGGQVLKALVVPVIENYKNQVRVLMYPWEDCKKSSCEGPVAMATQWMADESKSPNTIGRKVIIVGHSFGGHSAEILGNALASKGVKVDSVITIDPRKQFTGLGGFKSSGSARWINFYQKLDVLLMGWKVDGAENIYLNASPLFGHLYLPKNSRILPKLMAQIGNPAGSKIVETKLGETCNTKSTSLFGTYNHNGQKGDPTMKSMGSGEVASGISGSSIPVPEKRPNRIPVPSRDPRKAEAMEAANEAAAAANEALAPMNSVKTKSYNKQHNWMDGRPSDVFGNASGASKMGTAGSVGSGSESNPQDSDSNDNRANVNKDNNANRTAASLLNNGSSSNQSDSKLEKDTLIEAPIVGSNLSALPSVASNGGTDPNQKKMGIMVKDLISQSEQKESKGEDTLFTRINKITRKLFAAPGK